MELLVELLSGGAGPGEYYPSSFVGGVERVGLGLRGGGGSACCWVLRQHTVCGVSVARSSRNQTVTAGVWWRGGSGVVMVVWCL